MDEFVSNVNTTHVLSNQHIRFPLHGRRRISKKSLLYKVHRLNKGRLVTASNSGDGYKIANIFLRLKQGAAGRGLSKLSVSTRTRGCPGSERNAFTFKKLRSRVSSSLCPGTRSLLQGLLSIRIHQVIWFRLSRTESYAPVCRLGHVCRINSCRRSSRTF